MSRQNSYSFTFDELVEFCCNVNSITPDHVHPKNMPTIVWVVLGNNLDTVKEKMITEKSYPNA